MSGGGDGRFAIFDGSTGAKQQEFTPYTRDHSPGALLLDIDADGLPELFFSRNPGEPPLFTAYHWNGSTYAVLYCTRSPRGSGARFSSAAPPSSSSWRMTTRTSGCAT